MKEMFTYSFFSDEARFSLSGKVNSQNSRYWSAEKPGLIHELPLYNKKKLVFGMR
jgi:hypothetical protein